MANDNDNTTVPIIYRDLHQRHNNNNNNKRLRGNTINAAFFTCSGNSDKKNKSSKVKGELQQRPQRIPVETYPLEKIVDLYQQNGFSYEKMVTFFDTHERLFQCDKEGGFTQRSWNHFVNTNVHVLAMTTMDNDNDDPRLETRKFLSNMQWVIPNPISFSFLFYKFHMDHQSDAEKSFEYHMDILKEDEQKHYESLIALYHGFQYFIAYLESKKSNTKDQESWEKQMTDRPLRVSIFLNTMKPCAALFLP